MKTLALALAALFTAAPLAHADPGADLFLKKCAGCHGQDGSGTTKMGLKLNIRAFTTPEVQAKLDAKGATAAISDGIPEKKMPAFKEKLSADDLAAVASYVTTAFGPGSDGGAVVLAPAAGVDAGTP